MGIVGETYTATAFVNYDEHDHLTVATFLWEYAQPDHTYTIAPNPYLSVELDAQLVGRISRVMLYDEGARASESTLQTIVGKDIAGSIIEASTLGINIARGILTSRNREAIATLQSTSPSTPPLLRRAARMQLQALLKDRQAAESSVNLAAA